MVESESPPPRRRRSQFRRPPQAAMSHEFGQIGPYVRA